MQCPACGSQDLQKLLPGKQVDDWLLGIGNKPKSKRKLRLKCGKCGTIYEVSNSKPEKGK